MDIKKEVWFALIGIRTLNPETILKDAAGAFLNVAYLAKGKEDFVDRVKNSFKEEDFDVVSIDDIETEESLVILNPNNAENLELLQDIKEGYDFSWGVYHVFSSEE